ncbi:MAG: hypothetical protein KGO96_10085 [Elusimicrobia bacterium]|nr:hypothetical protein [Elusimicrobiota bacterium]
MTTKVMLLINGECSVHVHHERRDEHGRFVHDGEPMVIDSDGRQWAELYLPDDADLVIGERPRRVTETEKSAQEG